MTGQRPDSELIGDEQQAHLPPNTDGICYIFYSFDQKTMSGVTCSLQLCRIPLLFPVLFCRSVALAPVWQHSFVSPALMLSPLMCCMCAVYRAVGSRCSTFYPSCFPQLCSQRLSIVLFAFSGLFRNALVLDELASFISSKV